MLGEIDLLLVIGSRNSSNSNRLVEVARAGGVASYLIDDETEIDEAWLDAASRSSASPRARRRPRSSSGASATGSARAASTEHRAVPPRRGGRRVPPAGRAAPRARARRQPALAGSRPAARPALQPRRAAPGNGLPEHVRGQRLGGEDADLRRDNRGQADRPGRAPANGPGTRISPGPGRDRRQDGEQRRPDRIVRLEAEGEQRGDEQDPAAHAEHPGEDSGEQAHEGCEHFDHDTKGQRATPRSSAEKRYVTTWAWSLTWSALPATALAAAGRPTSAAYPGGHRRAPVRRGTGKRGQPDRGERGGGRGPYLEPGPDPQERDDTIPPPLRRARSGTGDDPERDQPHAQPRHAFSIRSSGPSSTATRERLGRDPIGERRAGPRRGSRAGSGR